MVVQFNHIRGLALDHCLQQRCQRDQGTHVTEDHPSLPAIRRDDHDRGALARSEVLGVAAEAREIDRHDCEDERLAGAPAADEPAFRERRDRRLLATCILAIGGELHLRHRQREDCRQEGEPGLPRSFPEPSAEELLVVAGFEDVHAAPRRAM
jgi:hypothetical protein